jgi:hypothetical protein
MKKSYGQHEKAEIEKAKEPDRAAYSPSMTPRRDGER